MKLTGLIIFAFIPLFLFSQQEYSIHDLKSGKFKTDTGYIYQLNHIRFYPAVSFFSAGIQYS